MLIRSFYALNIQSLHYFLILFLLLLWILIFYNSYVFIN